jgi:hypothetical protein
MSDQVQAIKAATLFAVWVIAFIGALCWYWAVVIDLRFLAPAVPLTLLAWGSFLSLAKGDVKVEQ